MDMFPLTYKPDDIHPAALHHVEVVSLLQKMSNTRERTITLDVEMEDYYRLKNETEKAEPETQPEVELLEINL